jgi:hypothetical protein
MKSALLIFTVITFSSCSNSDDNSNNSTPNNRNVRYEITGNYTGHFLMVYNDNVSGNTSVTVTALPWIKNITYTPNVIGIGIGGNTVIGNQGIAGQTATLKIYSGDTTVATVSSTADVNGVINFQPLSYVFP